MKGCSCFAFSSLLRRAKNAQCGMPKMKRTFAFSMYIRCIERVKIPQSSLHLTSRAQILDLLGRRYGFCRKQRCWFVSHCSGEARSRWLLAIPPGEFRTRTRTCDCSRRCSHSHYDVVDHNKAYVQRLLTISGWCSR